MHEEQNTRVAIHACSGDVWVGADIEIDQAALYRLWSIKRLQSVFIESSL
jgi:hypothetical protein